MISSRTSNLCSRLIGKSAGGAPRILGGAGAFASCHAAGVRPATSVGKYSLKWFWTALLLICLAPLQAISAQTGDQIINRAELRYAGAAPATATVAVTLQIRTKAIMELLAYAPTVADAPKYLVPTTYYQTGSTPADPFAPLPPPVQQGSLTPIDLSVPLPLVSSNLLHAGQVLFVKITDSDQNLDPTVAETIITTITNTQTGDIETLRLTETDPNTGIFIGFIQTAPAAAGLYNGNISVATASSTEARYVDRYDGNDVAAITTLVDPFGMVFDTITGKPVDGATVQLLDAATGLGAVVLGDNGASNNSYPHTVITGSTATDSEGNLYSFTPGGYRFPYVLPGNYILRITPPDNYNAPSTVSNAGIQILPGAPYAIIEPGSRGGVFTVPAGPAFRVDIPLDPKTGSLWLTKSAGKSIVSAGDYLNYDLNLTNNDTVGTVLSPVISDRLPQGFRYIKGSALINGTSASDPSVSADGSTLTFALADITPATSVTVRYVVAVGAGALTGAATNTAFTTTASPLKSNSSSATVQVQEPFMQSRNIIMGRVVVGACSDKIDDNKKGMEGIGIYLEDGTFVISDRLGMFHFEGVRSGTHVVQLDLDSIPEGYKILPCEQNSRFAGRAYSQFVDLQGGTMWRTDFYLGRNEISQPTASAATEESAPSGKSSEAPASPAATYKGEVTLEMISAQSDGIIDYRLPLRAHTVNLKNLKLAVQLPQAASYIPGSSTFNGTSLPDPEVSGATIVYPLENADGNWTRELQFRAKVNMSSKAGELESSAYLKFDTDIANDIHTPVVSNSLAITKDERFLPLPLFVFRPLFPTFGAELSDPDRAALDELINRLSGKIVQRIDVTGHTDNVRIAPRSRDIYADNRVLSMARAKSVGRYLAAALHLPPAALYLNGSGDKEPVATNRTPAGRALNRRVEVKISAVERVETTHLQMVKERSGIEKLETTGGGLKQPVPTAPPRLKQESSALQPAPPSAGTVNAADNPPRTAFSEKSDPQQNDVQLQKSITAAPVNSDEHAHLISAGNDGIVHYRLSLKNIKKPFQGGTATLIMPKNLLYMTGTSQLGGRPVADPDVAGATLTFNFSSLSQVKNFELRLQALVDDETQSAETSSSVTVVITDADNKPLKTFTAVSELSEDMDEFNRPDIPLLDGQAAKPIATGNNEAEEYREQVAKTVASATGTENSPLNPDNAVQVSEDAGILSPADNSVIVNQINAVRIVLNSSLTPVLLLDGKEITAERIGFSMKDSKTEKSLYTYIGVDFGDAGEHLLQLKGMDPFGVARFEKAAKVTRAGEITTIRLVSADGNIADGRTPVRIRVQLYDKDDKPVSANAELTLRGSDLRPLSSGSDFGHEAAAGMAAVSGDGWIEFQPVTSSGLYRVQLAYNKATLDIETYVKPKMRDWILVGIAEGTAGYNTLSGHMENARASGVDDHLYDKERLAFFAKGTIKGEWLLTMAYDSAKQSTGVNGNALFQTIDPNSFYTIYGDATAQGYEAASQKKLYLKIERDQFYAMFGDFNTGLTVTELSRYNRSMTGLKSEFRSKDFEVTAFGAETAQAFVKDELRGDGTSGLYRLSRSGIVVNSDKITIESRDRFHSETVIESRQLSRFIDYNIDYDSGAIFFKSPVPSRDEQFNPVYIVVDYEITNAGNDALTYGGRAGTTLFDGRLRAGATYVHEGQVSGESNLYGVDTAMMLGPGTKARAEFATTDTDLGTTGSSGNAWLAEVTHSDKRFDGRAYYREQENGFGLGQQNSSESGTRKYGVDGSYKLNQHLSAGVQGYRQYNLATGAVRDFIESLATYTDRQYSGRAGLRYVNDSLEDGSNATSVQATVGGSWQTLNQRLTLRADHEQSLFNDNDNADFPTRTIFGLDYQLTKQTLLFAQEELTYGSAADTNTTRVGVKSTPWSGGTVATSLVNDIKENSERTFANVGLTQKWQVNPHWAVDGGLDHNQTIRQKTGYQFDANVPPASGGDSFTAVSLGANYTERKLVWSNRIEYRNSDTDDKWGVISSIINEQGLNWGWTSRLQLGHTQSPGGNSTTAGDLRFGLAYRPPVTRWIVLDRLDLIAADEKTATTSAQGQRIVNNLNANYRPDKQTQLSIQYGSKYVMEQIDDRDYGGYTDLIGLEGRYDLTREWDLGLRSSLLHTWENSQFGYSFGPSVGYNVMENAWISLGYNIVGFHDKDFSAANYTAQGPFVQFRFKFDQNSVKDGLKALNQ